AAVEWLEDEIPVLRGDTGPGVRDANDNFVPFGSTTDQYMPARRAVALSVGKEVNEHLLEAEAIQTNYGVGSMKLDVYTLVLGGDKRLDDPDGVRNDVVDRYRIELKSGLELVLSGYVDEIGDEAA